jgi:cobalt-precorrin 5A hydrolase
MKIAVISVTNQGDIIASKIKEYYDIHLYLRQEVKERGLKDITREAFSDYKAIIYISSTGIAVRAAAPFLKSKIVDPAVLTIDSSGKFVISLVSGHLGGANELAFQVAETINAQPVITTATDNLGITAPDIIARNNNLIIDNFKSCKEISSLLVEGKRIGFVDERDFIELPKGYIGAEKREKIKEKREDRIYGIVLVTDKQNYINENLHIIKNNTLNNNKASKIPVLKLIRRDIILGIGCRKDFSIETMKVEVLEKLKEYNIDKKSVKAIATVEIKKDEKAIIELARYLGCELKIFSIDEIKKVQHHYEGSDFVEKNIGVRAVCEPCVELMDAELLTDKMKCSGMTLCIGQQKR